MLAYLRVRPAAESRRLAGLLLGGLLGTAVAFVALCLVLQEYSYLPKERSAYELFRFDLDLYVWFVVSLAAAYTAAGRTEGRRSLAVLAASPPIQLPDPVAFVLLEQWFAARGGF